MYFNSDNTTIEEKNSCVFMFQLHSAFYFSNFFPLVP